MESRNKLIMCRLCLGENECFINVFELNDWHSYIAAEVITDLLQFEVSETDGYPHVVCSKCLVKLTDFKMFKECCQKSKDKYDNMFVSCERLQEHQPEVLDFVTVKAEPIFYSDNEDNVSKDDVTVSLKSDYSSAIAKGITSDLITSEITIKEEHLEVQLTHSKTVKHPQHLQSLVKNGPHCASKGTTHADSCTCNISSGNKSIIDLSKNISSRVEVETSWSENIERTEGQFIHREDSMYMASPFQGNLSIGQEGVKEWGREDKDTDREGGRRSASEKRGEGKGERLECYHCGNILMTKPGLIHHMRVHGFGHSYGCDICGKLFPSKGNLNKHVLTHTGSKPYKCVECLKSFSQSGHLKTHMILHTGSKPYKCAECSKGFSSNSNLKQHMSSHTGLKPYKCAECCKSFSLNHNLKRHMRTHKGSKATSAECKESFSQNVNLNKNVRLRTGSNPYK